MMSHIYLLLLSLATFVLAFPVTPGLPARQIIEGLHQTSEAVDNLATQLSHLEGVPLGEHLRDDVHAGRADTMLHGWRHAHDGSQDAGKSSGWVKGMMSSVRRLLPARSRRRRKERQALQEIREQIVERHTPHRFGTQQRLEALDEEPFRPHRQPRRDVSVDLDSQLREARRRMERGGHGQLLTDDIGVYHAPPGTPGSSDSEVEIRTDDSPPYLSLIPEPLTLREREIRHASDDGIVWEDKHVVHESPPHITLKL